MYKLYQVKYYYLNCGKNITKAYNHKLDIDKKIKNVLKTIFFIMPAQKQATTQAPMKPVSL